MASDQINLRELRDNWDNQRQALTFWRTTTIGLLMFVLGNSLSYIVFGLKTASKEDLDRIVAMQNTQIATIRVDLDKLNYNVQEQTGELRARHILSSNN